MVEVEQRGSGPGSEDDFEEFFRSSYKRLHSVVTRRLAGSSVDADDVLQEGFVKIAQVFSSWPTERRQREGYARRVMARAAVDAIRVRHGRHHQPVREVPLDTIDPTGGGHGELAHDLKAAFARRTDDPGIPEGVMERVTMGELLHVLTGLEQRVLLLSAAGYDHPAIAARLGVSAQSSRESLCDARALLSGLLAHHGGSVSDQDQELLRALAERRLGWRKARRARRHLAACDACQLLAERAAAGDTPTATAAKAAEAARSKAA